MARLKHVQSRRDSREREHGVSQVLALRITAMLFQTSLVNDRKWRLCRTLLAR